MNRFLYKVGRPPATMTNLDFARFYACHGIPVLALHHPVFGNADGVVACSCGTACGAVGKHPMAHNGVHAATTDGAEIAKWFKLHPTANIGLACGIEFDVLDVDDPHLAEHLIADPTDLYFCRPGPIARTGRGAHFYFEPQGRSRRHPKFEWKSVGTYVVAPPSIHPTGQRYRWIDGHDLALVTMPLPSRELLELVRVGYSSLSGAVAYNGAVPPVASAAVAMRRSIETGARTPIGLEDLLLDTVGDPARYMAAVVRNEAARVALAKPGERNNVLNISAWRIGRALLKAGGGITESEVQGALLVACATNGYLRDHPQRSALATIASGLKAGMTGPP